MVYLIVPIFLGQFGSLSTRERNVERVALPKSIVGREGSTSSHFYTLEHSILIQASPYYMLGTRIRPTTGCRARPTSLWAHRNLFRQLSRDENLRSSGVSHATTVSPKPSFKVSLRVSDKAIYSENAEQTMSRRKDWKRISAEPSLISPRRPDRSKD